MTTAKRVGAVVTVWATAFVSVLLGVTAASAVPSAAPVALAAAASDGGYAALSPARLMDTRATGQTVDGVGAKTGAIGAGSTRTLKILGRGGVPASGVGAVVLNVTAVAPTAATYLTVFPSGVARPNASNLNVLKGQVSPNLVTVKVGSDGAVSFWNAAGSANVIADVAGYFPAGSSLTPLTPGRLMDTRATGTTVDGQAQRTGALIAGTTRDLQVTGRYGIPTSGVAAVVLNVTGVAPTANTYATVWPTGSPKPNASNLNLLKGEVKPNLVIAKLGTGGKLSFAHAAGSLNVIADVAGWIPTGTSYSPLTPGRLLDTRAAGVTVDGLDARGGALPPGGVRDVQVTGRHGIPTTGVAAVVLNVTGVAPTAATYETVYPAGEARPNASNLNLAKGEVRPNLVIAKVGAGGKVRLFNASGSTHLLADVAGWFATAPTSVPLSISTTTLPSGTAAKAYSTTLVAAGGTAPLTWSLTNATTMPAGMSLSAAGVFSGTPSRAGNYTVPFKVTDSTGGTATRDLAFTVVFQTVVITTTSLPAGTVGQAYSATLQATGSFYPGNWFLKAGSSLPPGLALTSAGVISGTPTANHSAPFTGQLVGADGWVTEKAFTITVTGGTAPLAVSTASLPAGTLGAAYSHGLTATGGTSPYTWTLNAGSGPLPSGLSLSSAGAIAGTPTATGTFPVTVRVTDATAATATKALSITVNAAPLAITTTTLPGATAGSFYSVQLTATGGKAPLAWTVSTALPAGLSLSSGGVLSGTPTAAGTSSLTFTVKDSTTPTPLSQTKTLSLKVDPVPVSVATTTLPAAIAGSTYTAQLNATGGTAPYTWALNAGSAALPAGLSLAATGAITGTPTTAGTYPFTVKVTDASAGTATRALSLTVQPAALAITTASLSGGVVNQSYQATLTATGGAPPYTWALNTGSNPLPNGLVLSSTGTISGTPSAGGTSTFTVKVSDTKAPTPASVTKTLSITVSVPPVTVDNIAPAEGEVGVEYFEFFSASGGYGAPYTFSVSAGTLPTGLVLDTNGLLAGAPQAAGSFTFTVQAASQGLIGTRQFTVVIKPGPLTITRQDLGPWQVWSTVEDTLSASGGTGPYVWSVTSGALPPGVTLSSTGFLSGDLPGTFTASTFTLQVKDATNAVASRSYTVYVNEFDIDAGTRNGTVGTAYTSTPFWNSGSEPLTWSVSSGSLPPGLTMSSASGSVTGTPTTAGTYTFVVRALDATGAEARTNATVVIHPVGAALAITNSSLPAGQVEDWYQVDLTATGGHGPYSFARTAGTLPDGLNVGSNCGIGVSAAVPTCGPILWGVPQEPGTFTFTLTVTDDGQVKASKQFTVTIAPAPLAVTTSELPGGAVGSAYSRALTGSGGTRPHAWSLNSGSMPPGLTLATSGLISGTPTTVGSYTVNPRLTDAAGVTATATFTLVVSGPATATGVAAGQSHSCAVVGGGVRCWGANDWGQLGRGTQTEASETPAPVPGLTGVSRVVAGGSSTCALLTDGRVACWGDNNRGQLADGSIVDRSAPVTTTLTGVTGLDLSDAHGCAVVGSGQVKCWGDNGWGQLGNGTTAATPVTTPVTVSGISTAVSVDVGASHSCAALQNGTVMCWGSNSSGELGTLDFTDSSVPVAVPGVAGATKVSVSRDQSCALLGSGDVWCWGQGNPPSQRAEISGANAISLSADFGCAGIGNTVHCWGSNWLGQLGRGSNLTDGATEPVSGITTAAVGGFATGDEHACAVLTNGSLRCWGSNGRAQVGNGLTDTSLVAVPVSGIASGATSVAVGDQSVCAAVAGSARCWGGNDSGQLGNGAPGFPLLTPGTVGGLASVTHVANGEQFACALHGSAAGKSVSCWGSGWSGQLGNGTYEDTAAPVSTGITDATAVAASANTACAIRGSGTVWCWGSGWDGELGTGSTEDSAVPVQAVGITNATQLARGSNHTCARLATGEVSCWGANYGGQLGTGDYAETLVPTVVPELSGVTAIAAGGQHTCAVVAGGAAKCWGANWEGALGVGDNDDRLTPTSVLGLTGATQLSAGQSTTCARLSDGKAACWGAGWRGVIGDGSEAERWRPSTVLGITTAVEVSTSGYTSCARLANGSVQCWGSSEFGQLGNGQSGSYATPVRVAGF